MVRTRPLAFLVAAVVVVLVVGPTATLLEGGISTPHAVVGAAATRLVGVVCLVGARRADATRTPYW